MSVPGDRKEAQGSSDCRLFLFQRESDRVQGGEAPDGHAPGNSVGSRLLHSVIRRDEDHDGKSGKQEGYNAKKPMQGRRMPRPGQMAEKPAK